MAKDLTASSHYRQNILNNRYALQPLIGLSFKLLEQEKRRVDSLIVIG